MLREWFSFQHTKRSIQLLSEEKSNRLMREGHGGKGQLEIGFNLNIRESVCGADKKNQVRISLIFSFFNELCQLLRIKRLACIVEKNGIRALRRFLPKLALFLNGDFFKNGRTPEAFVIFPDQSL